MRTRSKTVSGDSPRGFTLLEIMLAMAILAIAFTAVFQSQSQSISMIGGSRFDTTAPLLAQAEMARIEAAPLSDLSSGEGDFGDAFLDYRWRLDIAETQMEDLKKITLTVINTTMKRNNQYALVLYRVSTN